MTDSTSDTTRRDEALREYYAVQSAVDAFDSRSFQIKSWSVTVSTAAVGAALTPTGGPDLYLAAVIASIAFWLVDGLWKSFQVIWLKRGNALEELITQGDLSLYTGPQIHVFFRKHFKRWNSWLRLIPCMLKANVWMPHLPFAIAAGTLYWKSREFAGLDWLRAYF